METNPIKQYTELYEANRELFRAGFPDAVNALREEALGHLENVELPKAGSENYEITDLGAMLEPDYGLNPRRVSMPVNPAASFSCRVPNMSTALFYLYNDAFAAPENALRQIPEGVVCGALRDVVNSHPEVLRYFGTVAELHNPLVALNTMLVQDGFVLYVPSGVRLEKPIQLVSIFQSTVSMLAPRRLLIVLGDEAEARLLVCDHTQNHELSYLSLETIEIICGRNSRFDYYDIEESSPRTSRLWSLYASMEEGADLLVDGITLNNGTTRNEYYVSMHGEHCSLKLLGMGIEDNDRQLDTYSLIRHLKPRCQSDELFKYIVDDEAKGAFCGRIYVAPGAEKTEAYQSNRNVVGSERARMFSKPQLEIYNDDVKCSHGTAIGQFDEKQIFYMLTRGLSREQAYTLLKQAFMADVISGVRLEALRDRLTHLVEMRFAGTNMNGDCVSCKNFEASEKQ